MPCGEWLRRALVCAAALGALIAAGPARAHKGSDAYLQLTLAAATSTLRVDVALRDLDAVLDIDSNADGELTWGEIRNSWPAIERYLTARVQVQGCAWSRSARSLERRADGVYAALTWSGACPLADVLPAIHYTALREIDPTHRAIAKIERAGVAAVVQVLDPTQAKPLAVSAAPTAALAATAAVTATAVANAADRKSVV